MGKRWLCLTIWTASFCQLQAQEADSTLLNLPSDSVLTFSDSLDIFNLIDSLLTLEENAPRSQLAVRLAYNSNVFYAGRTLGIDQFGLSPGISYYHKSGFYGDVSTFWSHDFEPKYYLTIVSAGYMHAFSKHFSFATYYDRYFYNLEEDFLLYNNGFTVSPILDLKPFTFQCDYTFFFGETHANRLMPSVTINIAKKKFWGIDRVSFTPAFYMLFGDETFTNIIIPSTPAEWLEARLRLQQGLPWYKTETYSEFGTMNYSFSFPLNIQHKRFSVSVSYVYSIPKALHSETLIPPESGFVTAGVTYYINFKKSNSTF